MSATMEVDTAAQVEALTAKVEALEAWRYEMEDALIGWEPLARRRAELASAEQRAVEQARAREQAAIVHEDAQRYMASAVETGVTRGAARLWLSPDAVKLWVQVGRVTSFEHPPHPSEKALRIFEYHVCRLAEAVRSYNAARREPTEGTIESRERYRDRCAGFLAQIGQLLPVAEAADAAIDGTEGPPNEDRTPRQWREVEEHNRRRQSRHMLDLARNVA